MPYRYLDHIAIADAAFEAWGRTLEEVFVAAADATTNVMVENLSSIDPRERRRIRLDAEANDLLLFQFLQELVYYKDAEQLLLRVGSLTIDREGEQLRLTADVVGEKIDRGRHVLLADVKAVTLHRFRLEPTPEGWRATVVLDV